MNKEQIIKVKNRSAGLVVYKIPETGIRRIFSAGEEKNIPLHEIEQLTWQVGGKELIESYLQLIDPSVTEALSINTEPEYWLNEMQIKDLLEKGSLDQLLDALDFAPEGVIDLIKTIAVQIKLNNYDKRKAIKEKTGFDVTKAIMHLEEEKEDFKTTTTTAQRRVQPTTAPAATTPERRTPATTVASNEKKTTTTVEKK